MSSLGFPEYVREEILHQVLLMWNLFFIQKGPREKLSLHQYNVVCGDRVSEGSVGVT